MDETIDRSARAKTVELGAALKAHVEISTVLKEEAARDRQENKAAHKHIENVMDGIAISSSNRAAAIHTKIDRLAATVIKSALGIAGVLIMGLFGLWSQTIG